MDEPERPQAGVSKVRQVFLKNDVLRESSGPWYQAKRGLIIYDTSTMPIYIKGNSFFDFPATPDNEPVSLNQLSSRPRLKKLILPVLVLKKSILVDITEYWN